ncbi:MAG: thioredoxin family protein [Gemmatimonadota bacterium]|nr:MAG: thioredoxin family protein [Gemmatimonadota bacterium]
MTIRLLQSIVVSLLFIVCFMGCGGNESRSFTEVPALDEAQLKQTLSLKKYAMIEFGGRHCIPCKKMQPILTELSKSYGASISIGNVYVQEQLKLGREYKVRLIPTQIIFDKQGKEIFRHIGFWDKPQILVKWKELKIL